jgi:hypothetical protein
MHYYAYDQLVADRQRKYRHEAEQHRLSRRANGSRTRRSIRILRGAGPQRPA